MVSAERTVNVIANAALAILLAMLVATVAVIGSDALAATTAVTVLVGVGVTVLAWRQSMLSSRPRRVIEWPRVLAASALVCYMTGTLTFRARSGAEIASNPLDSAGLTRIVLISGAALLGLVALRACAATGVRAVRVPLPARLYLLYIALAIAGLPVALYPAFSLFAIVDFTVLAFVFIVAARAYRGDEVMILRVALGFVAALLVTVAIGVLFEPSRALTVQAGSPIPVRLQGVFPNLSYNTLGQFGLLFFAAGLAGQKPRRTLVVAGLLLVVLTQYRTGFVATLVIFAVYLIAQRRVSRLIFVVALVGAVALMTQTAEFQRVWLRGSSAEVVGSLSGRTDYWGAALEAVRRSPAVGLGIKSGARFEVLGAPRDANTSTVHNTWVEALVGVGLLGLAALIAAFLLALARAVRRMHTPEGLLALLLLSAIAVRSITGTTIELAGITAIVFLAAVVLCGPRREAQAALDADDRAARPQPPRSGTGYARASS